MGENPPLRPAVLPLLLGLSDWQFSSTRCTSTPLVAALACTPDLVLAPVGLRWSFSMHVPAAQRGGPTRTVTRSVWIHGRQQRRLCMCAETVLGAARSGACSRARSAHGGAQFQQFRG